MIKRYSIFSDDYGPIVEEEHPLGEWVKWEDIKVHVELWEMILRMAHK